MGVGRLSVFFAIVSVLLAGAGVYVGRRLAQAFGLAPRIEKVGMFITLGAVVGMILARVLEIRVLGQVVFTILLAVLLTAGLLLLADIVKVGVRLPLYLRNRYRSTHSRAPQAKVPEPAELAVVSATGSEKTEMQALPAPAPKTPPPEMKEDTAAARVTTSRRVFLGQAVTGSAMVMGSGSSAYGALFGRLDYAIEEVPVRIPGMSRRIDGYTLVQISDIHFGLFVGEKEIRAAEELVRQARPDRIVLTGDLVDSNPRYAEMLGQLVRRLAPFSRDGVVVIPGNHDWYTGVDIVMDAARAAGARILRNDGFVIGSEKDGFALLGVEDVWAKRVDSRQGPDIEKAISRVPADLPRVLLCHNPVFFPQAAGKVALQLSGHTHGGQVNLGPIRPGEIVLPYGYVQGRYVRDGSQLYINRGFGTAGPPARIGSPPEVTRVVLVSG